MKYKVVGLRVEKYLGTTCEGHNCDFVYGEEERDRHVILLKGVDSGECVELTLSEEEGECGSGWCTASYGEYNWEVVDTFAGKTHTIKEDLTLEISENDLGNDVVTSIFTYSPWGGCGYYPSGYYEVDMNKFSPSSD